MTERPTVGWYGKLPSAGDFVSRRIPKPLLDVLDDWLRRGLTELRAATPNQWRENFAAAPAWNCAIPGCIAGGSTLIGLIVPSHDRVGREFPLCAGVVLPLDAPTGPLLADAHGWLWELARIVIDARKRPVPLDVFDASIQAIALPRAAGNGLSTTGDGDILSVLGPDPADVPTLPMPLAQALPWPELPVIFNAGIPTSYWWTSPGAGSPLRGFTTDVGLAPSLLVTLMRPLTGRPGGPV
jgi:type VI secretion system protein ImpM